MTNEEFKLSINRFFELEKLIDFMYLREAIKLNQTVVPTRVYFSMHHV